MAGPKYTNANHPPFDDPNVYIYYRYYPSLVAAIIFVVCFSASTSLHIWQTARKRSWYFIPLIVGGFFEIAGYIGRTLSAKVDQWSLPFYILQAATLLVAPAMFAASIYMMLGKIIVSVDGQKYSIIRLFWLTKIFVCGDILSFVTQGLGAGLMAGGSESKLNAGTHAIVGGLVLQIVSFGIFIVVAIVFHRRMLRAPTSKGLEGSGVPWQKNLKLLYATSTLIMIRSIFRVIEYAMGNDGFILRTEVFLYIFDSVLMLGVMSAFNIFHPGPIVERKRTSSATEIPMEENNSLREGSSVENVETGPRKI